VRLTNVYCGLLLLTLIGCTAEKSVFKHQKEVIDNSTDLSKQYLDADAPQAKELLERNAKLLEEATILEPSGRALLLAMTYFRLYCLNERSSNEVAAKAALIKARYWRLVRGQLSGASLAETIKTIDDLTPERIEQEIDALDAKYHHGRPANYVSTLHHEVK
jgi:hypothetical protein